MRKGPQFLKCYTMGTGKTADQEFVEESFSLVDRALRQSRNRTFITDMEAGPGWKSIRDGNHVVHNVPHAADC